MEPQVPDLYTDSVTLQISPFGVLAAFLLSKPNKGDIALPLEHGPVVNLRMSMEHAKVLTILLNRELHRYEDQVKAKIPLHPQMVEKLKLLPDEWK